MGVGGRRVEHPTTAMNVRDAIVIGSGPNGLAASLQISDERFNSKDVLDLSCPDCLYGVVALLWNV